MYQSQHNKFPPSAVQSLKYLMRVTERGGDYFTSLHCAELRVCLCIIVLCAVVLGWEQATHIEHMFLGVQFPLLPPWLAYVPENFIIISSNILVAFHCGVPQVSMRVRAKL